MPVPEPFMGRPALSVPPTSPFEALRSGAQALRDGRPDDAVSNLEYAAARGVPGAIWKLGRMYADGEGVAKNTLRAFEYFRMLTKAHAYDPPSAPNAGYIVNAFISLGHIYLEGIADTAIKPDAVTAHEMFRYAASYFGDPEAQYQLGRLFLSGESGFKDPIQAARWLKSAAEKNHRNAQALLGTILIKGQGVPRQPAVGLFWLAVAQDNAGAEDGWITETYSDAFENATVEDRALAYRYLVDWLRRQQRTSRR
jgi:TPR repeat protein